MLRRRVIRAEKTRRGLAEQDLFDSDLGLSTRHRVISRFPQPPHQMPVATIRNYFRELKSDLSGSYLEDLQIRGYVNDNQDLTRSGVSFIRALSRHHYMDNND